MQKNINWTILLRYLNSEVSPEEETIIRNWLNSSKENREFMQFLEIIWQMEPDKKKKIDTEDSWNRFLERYDLETDQKRPQAKTQQLLKKIHEQERISKKRKTNIVWRLGLTGVAASILISIILSFQFFDVSNPSESGASTEQIEYREIRTEKGQRTRILLSDGSVIYLNGDSYLKIPRAFREDVRTVYLEGEAFFDIPTKENITFQVITAGSAATVLGTKFNVLSYPEDDEVTVVVAEGRVSLGYLDKPEFDSIVITKNKKGVIGYGKAPTLSDVANLSIYHGWMDGELVFEQEPLLQMIRKLERWYGIDIELAGSDEAIADKKLSATFSQNQSVDDVLQSISLALDLTITETNSSKNKYQLFSQP